MPGRDDSRIRSGLALGALTLLLGATPLLAQINAATATALPYRQIVRTGGSHEGPRGVRIRVEPTLELAPERLSTTRRALDEAQRLLHDELGLAAPFALEVVLTDLDDDTDGRFLRPVSRRPALVVLDATGDERELRDALTRYYAIGVAAGEHPEIEQPWLDAFGSWAATATRGEPSRRRLDAMRPFFAELERGLVGDEAFAAGGREVWLSFVAEAYGLDALGATLRGLASSGDVIVGLDRGLRSLDTDLDEALRELHLWSLLTGTRDDGNHFSFAPSLRTTPFATRLTGLPAISVRANAPVAPYGAAQLELTPAANRGGVQLTFEGEFSIAWSADLLLSQEDGTRYRLPFELIEGRGETTVPLQGVQSVWILIRNLGGDRASSGRYTVIAHQEQDYPMVLSELELQPQSDEAQLLSWETESEESDLIGFNVLRRRSAGGPVVAVNPVPIPALGEPDAPTSYMFLDADAEAGTSYEYRIEAVTRSGLTTTTRALRSTQR